MAERLEQGNLQDPSQPKPVHDSMILGSKRILLPLLITISNFLTWSWICSLGWTSLGTLSPKFLMLHDAVLCRLMYHIPHPAHISIDQDPRIQCLGEGSQPSHWNFLHVFSGAKAQHFTLIPNRATTNYKIFASSPVFVSESFFSPEFKLTGSCSVCFNFGLWDL